MGSARRSFWVGILLLALGGVARADTIEPGQVRVVQGTVSAVDLAYRAVVVEVPRAAGELTVGVTLEDSAPVTREGASVRLAEVEVGDEAELRYTRRDGDLVGLALRLLR